MEIKLTALFKREIRKYHNYCLNYGYNSRDPNSLLWYFNQKKRAFKKDDHYFITIKDQSYQATEVIDLFALEK